MKFFTEKLVTPENRPVNLQAYVLDNFEEFDAGRTRPAVIICPGGAYRMRSDREAEPVAIRMLGLGMQAFIAEYSVAPARFPQALTELATAVQYVREHAESLHVNPDQIIVAGFSAGGHLAGSLGVFWNSALLHNLGFNAEEIKPNALMLGYSVLSSGKYAHQGSFENLLGEKAADQDQLAQVDLVKQVNSEVPPTFLWHTAEDASVPCQNSLLFAQALGDHKIPFELHIFPYGRHGLGLANLESSFDKPEKVIPEVQAWPELFARWTKQIFSENV